jgi:sucrose-6-phosphate hydrolase SacC (GH32 family)
MKIMTRVAKGKPAFGMALGLLTSMAASFSAEVAQPLGNARWYWDMATESPHVKTQGKARVGVPLPGDEYAESIRRTSDGKVAVIDDGWIDVSFSGDIPASLSGEEYTIAIRFKPSGTNDGTLIARKGGKNSDHSYDVSMWSFEPWNARTLSFCIEAERGVGLVPAAPGAFVKAVNVRLGEDTEMQWRDLVVRSMDGFLELFLDGELRDRRLVRKVEGEIERTQAAGVELMRSYAALYEYALPGLRLGADPTGARKFGGMVDYLAIWNRALSNVEIEMLSGRRLNATWAGRKDAWTLVNSEGRRSDRGTYSPGLLPAELGGEPRLQAIEGRLSAMLERVKDRDDHFPRYHTAVPGFIYNTHAVHSAGRWHLFPMWVGDVNFCGWFGLNKFTLAHLVSEDLVQWRLEPFPIRSVPDGVQVCNASFFHDESGKPAALLLADVPGSGGAPFLVRAEDAGLLNWRASSQPGKIRKEGLGFTGRLDPAVFRRNGKWFLTGGRYSTELKKAAFPLYRSDDLETWDYVGVLFEPDIDHFIYECAQMLDIGGDRWLLTAGSEINRRGDHYVIGRFDSSDRFIVESGGRWDHGSEPRYIAHTAKDAAGRLVTWFTIPQHSERDALSDARAGWKGMQALPREVRVRDSGSLAFRPVPELAKLRDREEKGPAVVAGRRGEQIIPFATTRSGQLEIEIVLGDRPSARTGAALLDEGKPFARIFFEPSTQQLVVDLGGGPKKGTVVGKVFRTPPRQASAESMVIRAFYDRSVLEVFFDGYVISVPVFPLRPTMVQPAVLVEEDGPASPTFSARAWSLRENLILTKR